MHLIVELLYWCYFTLFCYISLDSGMHNLIAFKQLNCISYIFSENYVNMLLILHVLWPTISSDASYISWCVTMTYHYWLMPNIHYDMFCISWVYYLLYQLDLPVCSWSPYFSWRLLVHLLYIQLYSWLFWITHYKSFKVAVRSEPHKWLC